MTDPAAQRRRLITELRRLRRAAKMTQRDVAASMDWSPSKLIRIEQGDTGISTNDLKVLVAHYGVTDDATVVELSDLARAARMKQPYSEYRDTMQGDTVRYFGLELSAAIIRQFEVTVVPGLLQTEEYATTILEAQDVDQERIKKIVASRRERQQAVFERSDPPEAFFVVDEGAMRRAVGGPAVMARQYEHLLRMAALPRVTLQVLTFGAGAHPSLSGPFVYLEFPSESDPDVLYLESPLGDAIIRDDVQLTSRYRTSYWELEDLATRPGDFASFVSELKSMM